jgi:hypothetical protein
MVSLQMKTLFQIFLVVLTIGVDRSLCRALPLNSWGPLNSPSRQTTAASSLAKKESFDQPVFGKVHRGGAASRPELEQADYEWPDNLYSELRDMSAVSFMVYAFGYVMDTARTSSVEGFKGFKVSDGGEVSARRALHRSFTPNELLKIVEDNRGALRKKFDGTFGDNQMYELLINNLKTFQGT